MTDWEKGYSDGAGLVRPNAGTCRREDYYKGYNDGVRDRKAGKKLLATLSEAHPDAGKRDAVHILD